MGAHTWGYFVPYRENIAEALEDLKQQEFAAGRYYKKRGSKGVHTSIAEALAESEDVGTRSILDMEGVEDSPRSPNRSVSDRDDPFVAEEDIMIGRVAPLTSRQIVSLFGTERLTRSLIEANTNYYKFVDRGMGIYVIAYDGDQPSEILFAGYSFD